MHILISIVWVIMPIPNVRLSGGFGTSPSEGRLPEPSKILIQPHDPLLLPRGTPHVRLCMHCRVCTLYTINRSRLKPLVCEVITSIRKTFLSDKSGAMFLFDKYRGVRLVFTFVSHLSIITNFGDSSSIYSSSSSSSSWEASQSNHKLQCPPPTAVSQVRFLSSPPNSPRALSAKMSMLATYLLNG